MFNFWIICSETCVFGYCTELVSLEHFTNFPSRCISSWTVCVKLSTHSHNLAYFFLLHLAILFFRCWCFLLLFIIIRILMSLLSDFLFWTQLRTEYFYFSAKNISKLKGWGSEKSWKAYCCNGKRDKVSRSPNVLLYRLLRDVLSILFLFISRFPII